MCISKAEAARRGLTESQRRCTAHHPLSKYKIAVTMRKTGANQYIVSTTLSQLAKEGKNLPTPKKEEVMKFIQNERFENHFSKDLDPHTRKIAENQLAKAQEQAEKGDLPNGAAFNAWQKLQSAVKSKLARIVALTTVVPAIVVGCAAGPADPTPTLPEPTGPVAGLVYGDVETTGIVETDEHGSYQTVRLAADSPLRELDKSVWQEGVAENFTDEEVLDYQIRAAEYIIDYLIDGDLDASDEVAKANAEARVASGMYDSIITESSPTNFVTTGYANKEVTVYRNTDSPRVSDVDLKLTDVQVGVSGISYINFVFEVEAKYNITVENALKAIGEENYNAVKEDFLQKNPREVTDALLKYNTTNVAFGKESGKIAGWGERDGGYNFQSIAK